MDTSCTSSSCKQCRFAQEGIELLLPYVGQRISVLKEGPPKSCQALHSEIFFLIERSRFVFQAVLLKESCQKRPRNHRWSSDKWQDVRQDSKDQNQLENIPDLQHPYRKCTRFAASALFCPRMWLTLDVYWISAIQQQHNWSPMERSTWKAWVQATLQKAVGNGHGMALEVGSIATSWQIWTGGCVLLLGTMGEGAMLGKIWWDTVPKIPPNDLNGHFALWYYTPVQNNIVDWYRWLCRAQALLTSALTSCVLSRRFASSFCPSYAEGPWEVPPELSSTIAIYKYLISTIIIEHSVTQSVP